MAREEERVFIDGILAKFEAMKLASHTDHNNNLL